MFENEITKAVAALEPKLKDLDSEVLAQVEDAATLDQAEWLALGDKATRLSMYGIVSQDAAQTLYAIHSSFFSGATLAQRFIYMQAMGEALPLLREKGGL